MERDGPPENVIHRSQAETAFVHGAGAVDCAERLVAANAAATVRRERARIGEVSEGTNYWNIRKCPRIYHRIRKMITVLKHPPPSFFAP